MTDTRRDMRDPELNARLRTAVHVLRDEPPLRAPWRQGLLGRIGSGEDGASSESVPDRPRPRKIRGRVPVTALAAGLIGILIGAGGTYAFLQRHISGAGATAAIAEVAAAEQPLPVRFTLVAPNAMHVTLVGDFNAWNPGALPLRRLSDGHTWEVQVRLDQGRYAYAFVVDGRVARDPSAPEGGGDDYGTANSILLVPAHRGAGL